MTSMPRTASSVLLWILFDARLRQKTSPPHVHSAGERLTSDIILVRIRPTRCGKVARKYTFQKGKSVHICGDQSDQNEVK